MRSVISSTAVLGLLTVFIAGCGGDDRLNLAKAGGSVTWKGAPLSGATVTFIPEKGPVATGITDDEGKFTLSTGGRAGAVVGPCKVSITVLSGGTSSEEIDSVDERELMMKLTEKMGQTVGKTDTSKPVIPEKYGNAEKSGLQVVVTDDPSDNDFTLDLK